ncbi:hypothetical protein C8Q77DRAFT_33657 [Trametes polyzona]|nr:hypothetical protein C8Q77DRAFT_33657 [Trametes polyzona]
MAVLDTYVEPTGMKPKPGDKFVFVRPIPDSDYSIRLFPGSVSATEYCMDFVETATGEAVNSPPELELWDVSNPDMPHITMAMTERLKSIERAHGIKQDFKKIYPLERKSLFVGMDRRVLCTARERFRYSSLWLFGNAPCRLKTRKSSTCLTYRKSWSVRVHRSDTAPATPLTPYKGITSSAIPCHAIVTNTCEVCNVGGFHNVSTPVYAAETIPIVHFKHFELKDVGQSLSRFT